MAKFQVDFFVLLFLIDQVIASSINSVQAIQSGNDQNRRDIFYLKDFNTWNAISGTLSKNWTENHECFIELNAIKNGLKKHEEWAIRGKLEYNGHNMYVN